MNFLKSLLLGSIGKYKYIIIGAIVITAVSSSVYLLHYKPLIEKDSVIAKQEKDIKEKDIRINNLNSFIKQLENETKNLSFEKNQSIQNMDLMNELIEIEKEQDNESNYSVGTHNIYV